MTAECSRGTETTPAQETGMTVQDVERLRLHPYTPSGRNGYNKSKGFIKRKNSGKGHLGSANEEAPGEPRSPPFRAQELRAITEALFFKVTLPRCL